MKLFLLLACFFSFSFLQVNGQSQLHIATDYGNCGMGLKDSLGKWVVQPVYTTIYTFSRTAFRVTADKKDGLISKNGKLICMPEYDVIFSPDAGWKGGYYEVVKGFGRGLIDSTGKLIIPPLWKKIIICNDTSFLAGDSLGHWSIFLPGGKTADIPGKPPAPPFSFGNHLYAVPVSCHGPKRSYPDNKPWLPPQKMTRRNRQKMLRYDHDNRVILSYHLGAVDIHGKWIVPPKYDKLNYESGTHPYFRIQNGKHYGFLDASGKTIWPERFTFPKDCWFDYSISNGYAVQNKRQENYFSFFGIIPAKTKKSGLISITGDTVLPFEFDQVTVASPSYQYNFKGGDNFIMKKDSLTGLYNAKQGWLIPLEYSTLYSLIRYVSDGDSLLTDIMIGCKKGKWGCISSRGQEIVPFVYNSVQNGGNGNIFFIRGEVTYVLSFPTVYETIVPDYNLWNNRMQNKIVQSAPPGGVFTKQILKDGTVFFCNTSPFADSLRKKKPDAGFEKTTEGKDSLLYETAMVFSRCETNGIVPELGRLLNFKSYCLNRISDSTRTSQASKKNMVTGLSLTGISPAYLLPDPKASLPFGKVFPVFRDSNYTYYSMAYFETEGKQPGYTNLVFRDDGKIILKGTGYISPYPIDKTFSGKPVFLVNKTIKKKDRKSTAPQTLFGLIDGDGEVVLSPAWENIIMSPGNYLWVKAPKTKKSVKIVQLYPSHPVEVDCSWNIYDKLKKKTLLAEDKAAMSPGSIGNETAVIGRPEGSGLLDLKTGNYIIDPAWAGFTMLDSSGNLFAAHTCFGHIGIVDKKGNWLTDTSWTKMTGASYSENQYKQSFSLQYNQLMLDIHQATEKNIVLSKKGEHIIVNTNDGTIVSDPDYYRFLLQLAAEAWDTTQFYRCPVLVPDSNTFSIAGWQQSVLFDSMFALQGDYNMQLKYMNFEPSCYYCWLNFGKQVSVSKYPYEMNNGHFKTSWHNDSCFTFKRYNFYHPGGNYGSVNLYCNSLLFTDGPHRVLLDSLFTGNEWRNFIVNEILSYLNSHTEITGNCSNPAGFPELLQQSFLLGKTGLELYPPGYSEARQQLVILIPWEKLKPYLRADVASKIGI